jgi:(p)ppGpp synthase/HD superfamily hydrolase
MIDHEHAARLADRVRAVIEASSDRLDELVKATGLNPKADLRYGDWRGFDLTGADLRGFDFTGADLTGARFDHARIAGAVFDEAIYETASLSRAADFDQSSSRHPTDGSAPAPKRLKPLIRQYDLVERVRKYNPNTDEDLLNRAYVYAMKAHGEQKWFSGDPYISHPIEVAAILTEHQLDDATIAAALLHDTIASTETTRAEIDQLFGKDIGHLVGALTRLTKLDLASRETNQVENLRKLVLAIAEDVRVLLIKLADRLHNMRTIEYMRPEARRRIAEETIDIYAPLAGRIGMYELREELESLAFRDLNPEAHKVIGERLEALERRHPRLIADIKAQLTNKLANHGIAAVVTGRRERPYSIWRKMERKAVGFEQLCDIFGFRVIVKSVPECYEALAIIHTMWPVVSGQMKDYVSPPKQNDYRSIHTTVIGPGNQRGNARHRRIRYCGRQPLRGLCRPAD